MTQAPTTPPQTERAFIARQPIFDAARAVWAYELLFRDGGGNRFDCDDGDTASFHTLNNALNLIGLKRLTGGRPAFINFTRKLLIERAWELLQPADCVIEVLETVQPDAEVVEACQELRAAGYRLALDDFVFSPEFEPLLQLAQVVKVDFLNTPAKAREALVQRCHKQGIQLLAEKVETPDQFAEARDAGYRWFQGYFFCTPEVLATRDMRASRLVYTRFLAELNRIDLDFDELEAIVQQDSSLSLKLLRYLNSAEKGVRQKVESIKQALVLLGQEPLRKWGSLVALTGLGDDKPSELLTACLIRARFCEVVGGKLRLADSGSLFVMGLLSGLNAVMDQPMREVLGDLPLSDSIKQALLGRSTTLGKLFRLTRGCELGQWERVIELSGQLGLDPADAAEAHRDAILWADEILDTGA